jgi:Flp pilus assembly protein TadD
MGLFLLSLSPGLHAQNTGSVTVRVSDSLDESPIDHAEVRLLSFGHMNASYWGFTDGGGHMFLQAVERGQYRVEVKKMDYDLGVEQVDVAPGQSQIVLVRLNLTPPETFKPAGLPGTISARDAAIPAAARKEFDAGSKTLATDPQSSADHFRKAVEQYPNYAEAWMYLALAQLKLSKRLDALQAVRKAIEADPKFSKAYTLQGRLLLEDRDFEKAETVLQESIRLDPQRWDSHFEMARCYYNIGKINDALEHARQARDSPQASPIVHLLLADIYLKLDQKNEALAEMEAFAKADPASPMLPKVQQKIASLRAKR